MVKQILKSLCFSHGWCYAIFWRYDPINPLILRFEEAYNDEQFVDDMILQTPHVLGQGLVGEAALTGNHQWLFSDTLFQCQNQFLSGFKTVAIIPVGSSGVVQLGSTQKIVESKEMLEQTRIALQHQQEEMSAFSKPDDQSLDLDDTLFQSLLPLGDSEINNVPHQVVSFDDIFSTLEDDNPPSLLSPSQMMMISDKALLKDPCCSQQQDDLITNEGDDDFGFDILNSYSLDDLYQLLADSPPEEKDWSTEDHQENSMVIQGNTDEDLFDILGINSSDDSSLSVSHGATPLASPQPKGLFSELISSSLSNSTCCSLTDLQDYNQQSKRRKLDTPSSAHSSSFFFPQMMSSQAETVTPFLNNDHLRRSLWIDEDRSSSVAGNSKKQQPQEEEGLVKKKRAKAGESRKPRPKDRQMIQDRIKELRGLIPNGAKCSIDTLLDLTIKHMVFMQSLAKYADKLKQPYEPKLVNKERERTWAVEVGDDDQSLVCPIIVEDLNTQEGQMEIEMVCEESEQFLEIADVIRGLGLNILKGVMETRQGKMWAHFIVEANNKLHVTRIHVLCSLLHLFQQQNHTDLLPITTHGL